jgi:hypothetical protein
MISSITRLTYEEDALSFLEDLGYQKRDFTFLPETALDSPSAIDSINAY